MIIGLDRQEAALAWNTSADVVCPGCEFHIDETDNWTEYFGVVWHVQCADEDRRIQHATANDCASAYRD